MAARRRAGRSSAGWPWCGPRHEPRSNPAGAAERGPGAPWRGCARRRGGFGLLLGWPRGVQEAALEAGAADAPADGLPQRGHEQGIRLGVRAVGVRHVAQPPRMARFDGVRHGRRRDVSGRCGPLDGRPGVGGRRARHVVPLRVRAGVKTVSRTGPGCRPWPAAQRMTGSGTGMRRAAGGAHSVDGPVRLESPLRFLPSRGAGVTVQKSLSPQRRHEFRTAPFGSLAAPLLRVALP